MNKILDFLLKEPNAQYCEKATDALISRPWYAISNIPYMLVGIYIIWTNRKSRFSVLFGISAFLIGLFSFLYDATFTFIAQYFDWLGMFLFVLLLSLINLKRIFRLSNKNLGLIVIVILVIYLPLSLINNDGTLFFAYGVVFLVLTEVYLWSKFHNNPSLWVIALALFVLGAYLRGLDYAGIVCDPTNILNGRGLLHYLSSISILLLHRYYKKLLAINHMQKE